MRIDQVDPSRATAPSLRRLLRPAILLAAGLAVMVLAACGSGGGGQAGVGDDGGIRGIQRTPEPVVSTVTLPDATQAGADMAMVAAPGHLLLVYFGYTSCPDVCPTTLADVRSAIGDLSRRDAERVDLAMVTIDPARDSGDVLARYVRSFVPAAHALVTADDSRLRAAADAFGATYSVQPAADGGEPEVGHSAFLYAVDDTGTIVVTWSFGTPAADIAHDLDLLLGR
jgi:protein SCO1